jgi:predicted nucleic acid-binding protein
MSQIVVDTDVAFWSDLILSFMSVAELRMGAMSAGWGGQRRLLLERFVPGFELFYPDDDLCTVWARIRADARGAARAISPQDAWIAATALALYLQNVWDKGPVWERSCQPGRRSGWTRGTLVSQKR